MQGLMNWLKGLLNKDDDVTPSPDLRATNSHLRAAQVRRRAAVIKGHDATASRATLSVAEDIDDDSELGFAEDGELGYAIEDGGPGKNILSRRRVQRAETGTFETLSILDADATDAGEVSGFDPYNTGQFDRSRNWAKHTRK